MTKFDERLKLSVVKQCLSGKWTYAEVARRNTISETTVRSWVAFYERHGAAGLRQKFEHYDAQFRLQVLKQMWKHQWSYKEAALAFDIRSSGCLAVWERCYHSGGIDALKPRKRGRPPKMPDFPDTPMSPPASDEGRSKEDLLAEINQLRMENAYLKKLEALVQAQKQQRATTRKKRK
jgi:transposase